MLLEPQRPVRTGNYLPATRFDIVMRRAKPTATELSFFFCGFLIIVVGWLADLLGIFELGAAVGEHGGGSSFQLRLFLTMFGIAFSTIGVGYENFPEILTDADMAKRYLVAFLFLADGSLHLYAFNDHLGDRFPAAFFAVFSSLQIAAAFIIPYSPRRFDAAWLAITAFLIAAYLVTRTVSVWPIGVVEEVDALGVVSKFVEVVTVLALVSLWQSERASRRKAPGPAPAAGR